jgi:translation initiation factor IF-3
MKRVCLDLADVAVVEQEPRLLGRAINGLLGPK